MKGVKYEQPDKGSPRIGSSTGAACQVDSGYAIKCRQKKVLVLWDECSDGR
jgi:hypothetical protein